MKSRVVKEEMEKDREKEEDSKCWMKSSEGPVEKERIYGAERREKTEVSMTHPWPDEMTTTVAGDRVNTNKNKADDAMRVETMHGKYSKSATVE